MNKSPGDRREQGDGWCFSNLTISYAPLFVRESRLSLISALQARTYGHFRFRTNQDGRLDCFQNRVASLQSAE